MVTWWTGRDDNHGVVVDYRYGGEYRVIRINSPIAGQLYGQAIWMKSGRLRATLLTYKRAPGIYRANKRLGKDRGCSCNCCAHVSIPRSEIRQDGTLSWE